MKNPIASFTKFFNKAWNTFSFSDATPVMVQFQHRQAEKKDLHAINSISNKITKDDVYPSFENALPKLRTSPFLSVLSFEKTTLVKMFLIHFSDVIVSLTAAILSIQILKTFETSSTNLQLIQYIYSHPTINQKLEFCLILTLLIFILNVLAASLHAQKIELEMLLDWRIPTKLMQFLYSHLLNISKKDRAKFQSGDVTNMAQNDSRYIGTFLAHGFVDIPILIATCTLIMFLMLTIIGKSAWLGLLVICAQIPISLFFSWLGNKLHHEAMKRGDKRIQLITEWIQGMRLVRYFGWGKHFESEINKAAKSEFLQDFKVTIKFSSAFALTSNWWMLVSCAIFGGILYSGGTITPSNIFAAIWLSTILGQQITPLPWFVHIFSQSLVADKRLKKFHSSKTQEEEFKIYNINEKYTENSKEEINTIQGIIDKKISEFSISLHLESVSLRFSDNEPYVLKEVSLDIEPHQTTAIIGPVASGKSLLIQILMGDLLPTSGRAFICIQTHKHSNTQLPKNDKILIPIHSTIGLNLLRSIQSFVPQESFIVNASIRENVPLNYKSTQTKFDDNRIMNSLLAASLGQDLESFTDHLSTEIGERGVNLSGGQKQRLNLARSAFVQSSVIFLDDPLSAVDTNTEKELAHNIFQENWGKGKTIVWATHRLEFLLLAHKIIFLDQGQKAEEGTYPDLISQENSRLVQLLKGSTL